MNTGGFSFENFHDGDTTISGSLTISGNLVVNSVLGQSEYLDSGYYEPDVEGLSPYWNSLVVAPGTQAIYAKNGNIVHVNVKLQGQIKANQQFPLLKITVPAFDFFDVSPVGIPYVISMFTLSNGPFYSVILAQLQTVNNISTVSVQYQGPTTNTLQTFEFELSIIYKLDGDDIPATVLIAGGSSGSGVQNPMLNNLDGGGFNLLNFGNISSNTFNGGAILTNPLNVQFNANNQNIINLNELKVNQILSNTNGTPLSINEGVTMNNKNINDINEIKLNVLRANASGSGVQVVDNMAMNNKNITGLNTLETKKINNIKYVFTKADLPQFNLSGVFIICGFIVIDSTFTYNVSGDTTFFGHGVEESGLIFTNPSNDLNQSCINVGNHNVSFIGLRFGNQSSTFSLLNCNNPGKDRNLSFINCNFRGCKNRSVIKINGYDVVDFSNTTFQFNFPTIDQLRITGSLITNINSCIFYKQNSDGGGVVGTAPMMDLYGTAGDINIHGSFFEPQETQDGIRIEPSIVLNSLMINGNTFKDAGLTTGQLINYTPSGRFIINNNTGIRDDRAILSGVNLDNTVYTQTIIAQYVTVDLGPSFVTLEINKFAPSLSPFTFIYNARQPIYVMVNVNITADQSTGGTDVLLFALLKNNVPVNVLQVSVVSNTASTFGYNAVFPVVFGDSLRFGVQNQTAGTDNQGFRAIAFNGSLSQV